MATIEVKVPDIGDFSEVAVIELLVKPGDTVKAEQSLITVESDKASMEIPSSHAGVVKELRVALGDKVAEGSVVLVLEVSGAGAASSETAGSGAGPAAAGANAAGASASAASTPSTAANTGAGGPASAPASASAAGGLVEVRVPDIGDFKDVAVIEVFVKAGDTVKLEQSLITVESDKASMEIPSSAAGVIQELKVKLGDKVNIGDLLAMVQGVGAGAAASAPAGSGAGPAAPGGAAPGASASVTAPAVTAAKGGSGAGAPAPAHNPTATPAVGLPHASPSIRKFARELGVPLAEVKGSGPKGRITQHDVQAFTKAVMAGDVRTQAQVAKAPAGGGAGLDLLPWPKVDFAKFGPIESKPLSRIKKISAQNLSRNWVMIPAVTYHEDADITDLEAFRVQLNKENEKGGGAKLTMLAFLMIITYVPQVSLWLPRLLFGG